MKFKKLEEKYDFEKASNYIESIDIYPIGTEVLLTQAVDDYYEYTIDQIKEIDITDGEIYYYFDEAEMKVNDIDLIPYTINNEDKLKELGYSYNRNTYSFTDYMPVGRRF